MVSFINEASFIVDWNNISISSSQTKPSPHRGGSSHLPTGAETARPKFTDQLQTQRLTESLTPKTLSYTSFVYYSC